jgi:hypothetical protein
MIRRSFVYPAKMWATRDLMGRRNNLMYKRAELLSHIRNTNSQYDPDESFGCIAKPCQRGDSVGAFDNQAVKKSMEVNFKVVEIYGTTLLHLEKTILKLANQHDPVSYALLDSIYGIGKICASPSSVPLRLRHGLLRSLDLSVKLFRCSCASKPHGDSHLLLEPLDAGNHLIGRL